MCEKNVTTKEQEEYLKNVLRKKRIIRFTQIFILIAFFLLWEVAADLNWIDAFLFSQPKRMLISLIDMIIQGTLWRHIGITLFETIIGFMAGTALGTGIAICLWWNKFISDILEPYLVIINSLPKTALAPIIIVWMGNSMRSIIVTALLTSVIVTILTVLNGFLAVDEDRIKLVKSFGGTKRQVLTKVVLPASVPTIINALKINVGLSFVGVMVGEFLVAQAGLGYLIVYGSQIFKLDWVMLSVIILGIMSALLYKIVTIIEKKLSR